MKKLTILLGLLLAIDAASGQQTSVNFKNLKAELTIAPAEGKVSGDLIYHFEVLKPVDSIFIDAKNMTFHKVTYNGRSIKYINDQQRLWLLDDFKTSSENILKIQYPATPDQTMYFIETRPPDGLQDYQVWTQGQGKNTSHWLPSFDDPSEKLEFDLSILYEAGKKVVANGKLLDSVKIDEKWVRWNYDMQDPMSSYLVAVAAGDYQEKKIASERGVPIRLLYPTGKKELVEPTYRYSAEMMDFLEEEIGVRFPWQTYKQIPVRDFLYAGMENTGTTIFSDMFLVDSIGFNDRNYVMVNAHELAHQWFGDMVTAASGEHHWLQEGFATYYALLVEREIFGEDYFYWKLYQSAEQLKEKSDSGRGESLLDPKASSLTFYQKGAWALHILKNIIGKEAFDAGVQNYLIKHAYGNVTTDDFLQEVERTSGKDLSAFRKDWLEQTAFQGSQALEVLKKSPFVRDYMEVAALIEMPLEAKKELLDSALDFPVNDYIGQEVVYQLAKEDAAAVMDLYKKAFQTNNLYIRQAIALSLQQIPEELKTSYVSLLEDPSYVTQETALFNLWLNFPEDRHEYLQKMDGKQGFMDKNLRTLWLALSIATPGTEELKRKYYLEELSSYTAPHHRFQVRQHAFGYLYQLRALTSKNIHDLVKAGRHPHSGFRNFARTLLKKVLELENLRPADRDLLEQELGVTN